MSYSFKNGQNVFILKNLDEFRDFTFVNNEVGFPGKVRSIRVSSCVNLVIILSKGGILPFVFFVFSKNHGKTTWKRPFWESNPALSNLEWTF